MFIFYLAPWSTIVGCIHGSLMIGVSATTGPLVEIVVPFTGTGCGGNSLAEEVVIGSSFRLDVPRTSES